MMNYNPMTRDCTPTLQTYNQSGSVTRTAVTAPLIPNHGKDAGRHRIVTHPLATVPIPATTSDPRGVIRSGIGQTHESRKALINSHDPDQTALVRSPRFGYRSLFSPDLELCYWQITVLISLLLRELLLREFLLCELLLLRSSLIRVTVLE